MPPKVIIHNSTSLDGSLTRFRVNMGLHYRIAGWLKPDVHLIGSNTILHGVKLNGGGVPREERRDFQKPRRTARLPLWAVVDSRARLKGLLHTCRRFEFCRDVIVLVSQKTPGKYLDHLRERNYDVHAVGREHVDHRRAISLLAAAYGAKTIMTDAGRVLGNLLLRQGLVDEISLVIHPEISGKKSYNMFGALDRSMFLSLYKKQFLERNLVWLLYKVKNKPS